MRFLALSIVVFALVAAPVAQRGVDGTWTVTFDTPMGSMEADATFQSAGEELTGTLSSQMGSAPFKGTVKGTTLNFTMHVPTPQGDVSISLTGELEGDIIKGTFDFGQGVGNWFAKRKS